MLRLIELCLRLRRSCPSWRLRSPGPEVAPLYPTAPTRSASVLYYAVVFLIIAIIAGVLGFWGLAATAAMIAKVIFVIFLILALISFLRRA